MTDPVSQIGESATYCAPNDPKRPDSVGLPDFTYVQICDDDPAVEAQQVTDAYPDGWYVRIMFDELLDPNVEQLKETGDGETFTGTIKNTRPVILECESVNGGFVEVPYDGYYNPAGNRVTWPLGPSLVVKPDEPRAIATGKTCRITIRDTVKDKSGTQVPEAQRGPFEFKIAPITPLYIDPSDGAAVTGLNLWWDNVYVQFNTDVDASSFCDEGPGMDECEFAFYPLTGDPPTAGAPLSSYSYPISGSEFGFGPDVPLETESAYRFAFIEGTSIKDRCGVATTFGAPSAGDLTQIDVTTAAFDLSRITPTDGDTVSALGKPTIVFNNVVDLPSLEASELSIDPVPDSFGLAGLVTDGGYLIAGHYQPDTEYTLTLNAGATVDDVHGATYTHGGATTITFRTQPIALTGTSPANGGRITKSTPGSATSIALVFNQSMDPASIEAAEIEFSGGATAGTPVASGCGPASTSCAIVIPTTAPLDPGDYTFTLKAGATIEDVLGNVYTQAADRVVNFTVVDAVDDTVQCL